MFAGGRTVRQTPHTVPRPLGGRIGGPNADRERLHFECLYRESFVVAQ